MLRSSGWELNAGGGLVSEPDRSWRGVLSEAHNVVPQSVEKVELPHRIRRKSWKRVGQNSVPSSGNLGAVIRRAVGGPITVRQKVARNELPLDRDRKMPPRIDS